MRGHRFRIYVMPFDINGNYTSYQEVTDDVDVGSLGTIDQELDNTDYDIGVFRVNNISISFRNDSGKYSDVGQPNSIFQYTRGGSKVKITWDNNTDGITCGFFKAGNTVLANETVIFMGLLNDDSVTMDLDTQVMQFALLGLESVLTTTLVQPLITFAQIIDFFTVTVASPAVFTTISGAHGLVIGNPVIFTTTGALPSGLSLNTPYYVSSVPTASTFTVSTSLGGGNVNTTGSQSGTHECYILAQDIKTVMLAMLNQTAITSKVEVRSGTIHLGIFAAFADSVVDLQNKTVWDAMTDLLLLTNSTLYLTYDIANDNMVINVASRTATSLVQYNFYGQSSIGGAENIQNIQNITSGLSKVFNYISFQNTGQFAQDTSSAAKYGSRIKQLSQTYIVDPTAQLTLMNSLLSSFSLPKQEFDLFTPITTSTIALGLLNKISIDFPPMYLQGSSPLPICGLAVLGAAILPNAIWSFVSQPTDYCKIIGKEIDPQTDLIRFRMRRI